MPLEKIPYRGKYPSTAQMLIAQGYSGPPRQIEKSLGWAEGIDIVYTLRNIGPTTFKKLEDYILLLAYQEATRYKDTAKWKFANIDVKLGRLKKGRDLPEVATFQASMHDDPEIMVYGPGYEVPNKIFLKDKLKEVLDLVERYPGKLNKQNPYKVVRLTICIREPRSLPTGPDKLTVIQDDGAEKRLHRQSILDTPAQKEE